MQQVQVEQFREEFVVPSLSRGKTLGLRLPLSIAIICDIAVNSGWHRIEKLAESASVKLGGNPGQGVDEKKWDMALLDARADFYRQLVSSNPNLSPFLRGWLSRVDAFRTLATRGNWNLTPEELAPQLASAPN